MLAAAEWIVGRVDPLEWIVGRVDPRRVDVVGVNPRQGGVDVIRADTIDK
jgi:hypothetical protein